MMATVCQCVDSLDAPRVACGGFVHMGVIESPFKKQVVIHTGVFVERTHLV